MFFTGVKLTLQREGENRLVLKIPATFRISMTAIACALFFGTVFITLGGMGDVLSQRNTLPLILIFLALVFGFYKDRWVFDRSKDLLAREIGVLFLFQRKCSVLSNIQRVEVTEYARGSWPGSKPLTQQAQSRKESRRRSFLTLTLADSGGKVYRLEHTSGTRYDHIVKMARQLSDFCTIDYVNMTSH